jgi:serine/threonine-protein kinase HipA
MMINNKSEDIQLDDLIQAGIKMGVSKVKAKTIIEEVRTAVGLWSKLADQQGIREQTIQLIGNTISDLVKL